MDGCTSDCPVYCITWASRWIIEFCPYWTVLLSQEVAIQHIGESIDQSFTCSLSWLLTSSTRKNRWKRRHIIHILSRVISLTPACSSFLIAIAIGRAAALVE